MSSVGHVQNSPNGFHQENTDISGIPAGLTGQLQPLAVYINKPFNNKARVLWTEWMAGSAYHALTQGGRLKKPSVTM